MDTSHSSINTSSQPARVDTVATAVGPVPIRLPSAAPHSPDTSDTPGTGDSGDPGAFARLARERDQLVADLDHFSQQHLRLDHQGLPTGLPYSYGELLARQQPLPLTADQADQEISDLKASLAFLDNNGDAFHGQQRQQWLDLKTSYTLRLVLLGLPGHVFEPLDHPLVTELVTPVGESEVPGDSDGEDDAPVDKPIPTTGEQGQPEATPLYALQVNLEKLMTMLKKGLPEATPPHALQEARIIAESQYHPKAPSLIGAIEQLTLLCTEFNRIRMAPSPALCSELILRVTDCIEQSQQGRPQLLALLAELSVFLRANNRAATVRFIQKHLEQRWFLTGGPLLRFQPCFLIAWLVMENPDEMTKLMGLINLPAVYQSTLPPGVIKKATLCFPNQNLQDFLSWLLVIVTMIQLVETRQVNSAELVIKSMVNFNRPADRDAQGPLLAMCIDYHLVCLIQATLAYSQGGHDHIETLLKLLAEQRKAFCSAYCWQQDPPQEARVWYSTKVMLAWAERCAEPLNSCSQVTFPDSATLLHTALLQDTTLLAASTRVANDPGRSSDLRERELYLVIALGGMVTTCAKAEGLLPCVALGGTDFTEVNRFLWPADFPERLLPLLMRYSRAFDQYVQRCCQPDAWVSAQPPGETPVEDHGNSQMALESMGVIVNHTTLRPQYLATLKELICHQGAVLSRAGGAEPLESLWVALLRLAYLDSQYQPDKLIHSLVPKACVLNWYGSKAILCGTEPEMVAMNRKWADITRSPISLWYLLRYLNDEQIGAVYGGWGGGEWDKQYHPDSERQQFKTKVMIPRFRAITSSINLLINLETPWPLLPILAFLLDNREGIGLFSLLEWLHAPSRDFNPRNPLRPVDIHTREVLTLIAADLSMVGTKEGAKEPKRSALASDKEAKPTSAEDGGTADPSGRQQDETLFGLRQRISALEIFSACDRQGQLPSVIKLPTTGLICAEQCTIELLMARSAANFKKLVPTLKRLLNHMAQHGAPLPYAHPALQSARGCYHSNLITLITMVKRIFNRDFSDPSGISKHCLLSGHQGVLSIFVHLINQDLDKLRGELPEYATDPFFELLQGQLCLLDYQQEQCFSIAQHYLREASRYFHAAIAGDYPPARACWAATIVRFPEIVTKGQTGIGRSALIGARYILDWVGYEKDRELQVVKLWLDYQEYNRVPTPEQLATIAKTEANSLSHVRSYYRLWSLYRQDNKFLTEGVSRKLVHQVLTAATPMSVLYLLLDIDLPAFKQEAIDWFIHYQGDDMDNLLSNMGLFWPTEKQCVAQVLDGLLPRLVESLHISTDKQTSLCAKYPDPLFWQRLAHSKDSCNWLLNQLTAGNCAPEELAGGDRKEFKVVVSLLSLLPRQHWRPGTGHLNRLVRFFQQQLTTDKAVLAPLLASVAFDPTAGCDQPQQTEIITALMVVFQDRKYFKLSQELLPNNPQCRHLLLGILVETLRSGAVNVRMAQTLIAIIDTLPKGFDRESQRVQQWELSVCGLQLAISKQFAELVRGIRELGWTLFQQDLVELETMEREQRIDYLRLLKQGGQNLLELIDNTSSTERVNEVLALEGEQPDYQRIIPILAQPRSGQPPAQFLDRHFPALLDRCNNMANPDHRAVRGMILTRVSSRQLAERVPSAILRHLFLERVSQPSELGTKLLRARLLQQSRAEWQPKALTQESYLNLESTAIYLVRCGSAQELADWVPVYLSAMVEAKRGLSAKKRQAGVVQLHSAMGTIRTHLLERFPQVITAALLTHASANRLEAGQQFAEALLTLTCRCLAADQSDTSPLARSKEKQGLVDLGATIPASCLPVWLTLVGGCPWSRDETEILLGSLLSHCVQAQENHPPGSPLALEQPLELVRQLPQYLQPIDLTEMLARTPPLAEQARALIRRCEQGRAVAPGVAIQELLQEADTLLATLQQDRDKSVSDWHALQVRTRLQFYIQGGHGEVASAELLQAKELQLRVALQASKIHQLLATSRSTSPKKMARIVNKWLEQLKKTAMLDKVMAALSAADRELLRTQYGSATGVIPEPQEQQSKSLPQPPPPSPSSPPPVTQAKGSSTESYNRSFWLNLIRQGAPGNGLEQFFSEILTLPPCQCLEPEELDELHQWFQDKIHRHFQDKGVFTPLSNLKGAAAYDARCRLVDLVMANTDLKPTLAGPLLAYKAAVLDDKQVFFPKLAEAVRRDDEQVRVACIIDSCRLGCALYVRFVGIAWPEGDWISRALTSACTPFTLPALGMATVPLDQGCITAAGNPEQVKQLEEHMGLLVSSLDSMAKALVPETVKTALGTQLHSTLMLFQQLKQAHDNLVGIDLLLGATFDSDQGMLGAYQRLETMQGFIRQWQDNKEWWSGTQGLVRDASLGVRRALQLTSRQVASRLEQLRPQAQVIELAGQLGASEEIQWEQLLPLLELSGEQVGLLLPRLELSHLGQMDRLLQAKLQTGGKKTRARYREFARQVSSAYKHRYRV